MRCISNWSEGVVDPKYTSFTSSLGNLGMFGYVPSFEISDIDHP